MQLPSHIFMCDVTSNRQSSANNRMNVCDCRAIDYSFDVAVTLMKKTTYNANEKKNYIQKHPNEKTTFRSITHENLTLGTSIGSTRKVRGTRTPIQKHNAPVSPAFAP